MSRVATITGVRGHGLWGGPGPTSGGTRMAVESTGDSPGNPRLYKVIEHTPKTGKSPTVWAWPQLIDYLKVAGQPVQGPWPPHQQRRPDPEAESLPVAVPDPVLAIRPDARRSREPQKGDSYLSVTVPLRSPTFARRGDQPAERRRRRGQGVGRRTEPRPHAEAPVRVARDAGRHQQHPRPRATTTSTRTARSASARCAGTPTSSTRRSSPSKQPTMAAAAPLVADPIVRNRGTLVGSLCHADPQGDWASVVTALGGYVVAKGRADDATIPVAQFVSGPVPERARDRRDRDRSSHPGAQGRAGRRLPQARAPRRRLRHRRRRRRHRAFGRFDHPRRHRADRRRRLDDRRHPTRRRASSVDR